MKKKNTQKNTHLLLLESTALSRCFSKQGIKIPIRNESPYKRNSNAFCPQEVEPEKPKTKFTRLPISDFLSPE